MNGQIDNSFQRPITGTISAANGTVDLSSPNQATETIQVSGTWVGTIILEASNDGTTYYPMLGINNISGLNITDITANGIYLAQTNGFAYVRVRASAWTSGIAVITVYGSDAASLVAAIATLRGSSDGTMIGNVADKLKVTDQDVLAILTAIGAGLGVSTAGILKQNEVPLTTRTEFDLANTTYTVPANKKFSITSFSASYDFAGLVYIRLKKQTGGVGAFNQLFRIVMMQGSQGDSAPTINFGNGVQVGSAGDVFKITVEGSVPKGTVWAEYSGSEI